MLNKTKIILQSYRKIQRQCSSIQLYFLGGTHHSALMKEDVFQDSQDNAALLHPETNK